MVERVRVFLETSALFAGIWSRESAARLPLRLGEAGAVHLLVSALTLAEIESTARQSNPESLGYLALALDRAQVQVVPSATQELIDRCQSFTSHPGDARLLADALVERIDYFVTTDEEHFLAQESIRGIVLFAVVTPEELMEKLRNSYA